MRIAMSFASLTACIGLLSVVLSKPIVTPTSPADAQSTACGDIIVASEQGYRLFYASSVFECLRDVPFNEAVATRFIRYYNQTLQFQSTLAFLKQPPEGYQQPPVDVVEELQKIQNNVTAGVYQNQYTFEADLQLLINRIHDAHVTLSAGALAPFAFVSPYGLISASPDGKQLPKIFLEDDILSSRFEGWRPSPVTHINDVDVVDWLKTFSEIESLGYVERHADWNALFEAPARDIQGGLSVLQSASFYPGDELDFTLENGTKLETFWLATYDETYPTGPLTTSGDFYNYFVLGIWPAGFDPEENTQWWPNETDTSDGSTDNTNTTQPTYGCANKDDSNFCSDSYGAYPDNPDVAQMGLAITSGGVVSGYFFDDISTGVLSLPSFWQSGHDINNFFVAVDDFIRDATNKNIERVVIDLQQNDGGLSLLALSIFKRFFYAIEPYAASRIRSHELADVLGTTYSQWWDSLEVGGGGAGGDNNAEYLYFASSEWVATNRINPATGTNFSSWAEYYGPILDHGDDFSLPQRLNLSDEVFDAAAFQTYIPYGYGKSANPNAKSQVWAPENIVLLTDGLCSSACAFFVELMVHEAGAKTIVVGGRPETGPMQTVSGSRGARSYSADDLDFDMGEGLSYTDNNTANASLPSREDTGMYIGRASFNIRDHVRENDPTPLQFKYEAADCRIYYTLENVYNMTRLWRDAAAATWDNESLCVAESTGYPSARNTTSAKQPPPASTDVPSLNLETLEFGGLDNNTIFDVDVVDGPNDISVSLNDIVLCQQGKCSGERKCVKVRASCQGSGKLSEPFDACCRKCVKNGPCNGYCNLDSTSESKAQSSKNIPGGRKAPGKPNVPLYSGFCEPTVVNPIRYPKVGCPK